MYKKINIVFQSGKLTFRSMLKPEYIVLLYTIMSPALREGQGTSGLKIDNLLEIVYFQKTFSSQE